MVQPVQPLFVAGAMDKLVKGCAVIGGGGGELLHAGQGDAVGGGLIESLVTVLVVDRHAAALHITGHHGFCLLIGMRGIGKPWRVPGCQAFALGEVENAVIPQEGNLFRFAGGFILLLDKLPEDYYAGLFALPDVAALGHALMEGDVFPGLPQEHLIQQGIGPACDVADSLPRCNPGLLPGDLSGFQLGHDPFCDGCVNIHDLLLS
ncbi:MAG: hypothetical protein SOY30_15710 [Eubacteriales bacterium]|nr:hypothetical protein [Eubacteriales bacterium]